MLLSKTPHDKDGKTDLGKAKRIALRILKVRNRSEYEIREKLLSYHLSGDVIEETLDYLKKVKLVDDPSFARDWVENRKEKSYGAARILAELKAKGITDEIINSVIESENKPENERKAISHLIEKLKPKYTNLSPETVKQRLFENCVRRGFSEELVEEILNAYENRRDS